MLRASELPTDSGSSTAGIVRCSHGILELRCKDDPNGNGYLYWCMPVREAIDLARWWRAESIDVKNGQTAIRDKRVGNILISMFAPTWIHVRGLDQSGRVKLVGYSFPRVLVEYLASWAESTEECGTPFDQGMADQCSNGSL